MNAWNQYAVSLEEAIDQGHTANLEDLGGMLAFERSHVQEQIVNVYTHCQAAASLSNDQHAGPRHQPAQAHSTRSATYNVPTV